MRLRLQAGILLLLLTVNSASAQAAATDTRAPARAKLCLFQGDGEREKARQQIGISVQQQEQLTRLYAEADRKEKAIGKDLHDLYRQQRTLYSAYVIDHGQERELRKKIEQMHSQLLQLHADTEDGLRKLLTREQFERLNAAVKDRRRENRRDPERHSGEEKTNHRNGSDREHENKPLHLLDVGPGSAAKASLSAPSQTGFSRFSIRPALCRAG
jgi:Spy/CpxP family protein refolding chaperone